MKIRIFFVLPFVFFAQQIFCLHSENIIDDSVHHAATTLFELIEGKNEVGVSDFLQSLDDTIKRLIIDEVRDKKSPIERALLAKSPELIGILLDHGANIFLKPEGGKTIFHLAVSDPLMLQALLKIVVERKLEDKIPIGFGELLHQCIYEKKRECLSILIEEGSPFRQFLDREISDIVPIHSAFLRADAKAVEILIKAGANLTQPLGDVKVRLIHVAASRGDLECFRLLLEALKDKVAQLASHEFVHLDDYLTVQTHGTKMTPKHYAALRGNHQVLEVLLTETVSDLDFRSAAGMTATAYAVSEGHFLCLFALLRAKPNLYIEDNNGLDVFTYAGYKNRFRCGALLMDYLNRFRFELENSPKSKRDLLADKKRWLHLSLSDMTHVIEVSVTQNPTYEQFFKDLQNIRSQLVAHAADGIDHICWKKYPILHMKYMDANNRVIARGAGVVRDYITTNASLIFGDQQDLLVSDDDGRSYGFAHQEDDLSSETLQRVNLIGFFVALSVLYNPAELPLAQYIFKIIADENPSAEDFIGKSLKGHLDQIQDLSSEEFNNLDLPTSYTVKTSRTQSRTLPLLDAEEFLTKETYPAYRRALIYLLTHGGKRRELLQAFKEGFNSLIPNTFLKIDGYQSIMFFSLVSPHLITASELQSLVGEVPLDPTDWMEHTNYVACSKETPQVQWFWNFVQRADVATRKKLLKFCTGSHLLQTGGFERLARHRTPFTIEVSKDASLLLPTARTCFYTISLPLVDDEETFNKSLLLAIDHCDGFHFI